MPRIYAAQRANPTNYWHPRRFLPQRNFSGDESLQGIGKGSVTILKLSAEIITF